MHQRFSCAALTLVLVLIPARSGLAWNKAGHMVSGAIAYQVLKKEDPQVLAKVVALLKEHPDYEHYWAPRVSTVPEEDRPQFDKLTMTTIRVRGVSLGRAVDQSARCVSD